MKFLYGLGGANIPVIKEFEMAYPSGKVEAGDVVKFNSDGKVSFGTGEKILGVAAEYHSGKEDILNPRANGDKLRVDVTAKGVYRADAPRFTATGLATDAIMKIDTNDFSNKIVGATLVLVKKGKNSDNTDEIGTKRKVTNYSTSGSTVTLNIEAGGVICEGDIYAAIPAVGLECNVSEDNKTISYGLGNGGAAKVVGRDLENATIDVIFPDTFFD